MTRIRKWLPWVALSIVAFVICTAIICLGTSTVADAEESANATSVVLGAFSVQADASSGYKYEDGILTIDKDITITIANSDFNTATTDRIFISSGASPTIILSGVNIDTSAFSYTFGDDATRVTGCGIRIAPNSTGNVTLVLDGGTTNIVKTGINHAAIEKGGNAEGIGTLTICTNSTSDPGKLTVKGGGSCAGIGGSYDDPAGEWEDAQCANILISGGIIVAEGGEDTGYGGAGIGGAIGGGAKNIVIKGGHVTATGANYAAGIGGAIDSSEVSVIIEGGVVVAQGTGGGAGIGAGKQQKGNVFVTIKGGTVSANSIGNGGNEYINHPDAPTIVIDGGSVKVENEISAINSAGESVSLVTVSNAESKDVMFDGKNYLPVNHLAADSTDDNLYIYFNTGATCHSLCVGDNCKHYYNGRSSNCTKSETLMHDQSGHWYPCESYSSGCYTKFDYVQHSVENMTNGTCATCQEVCNHSTKRTVGDNGVTCDTCGQKIETSSESDGTTTYYASFSEALSAITAGATIKLECDIQVSDTILVSKDCTVDFNNHYITNTTSSGDDAIFSIAQDIEFKTKNSNQAHPAKIFNFGGVFEAIGSSYDNISNFSGGRIVGGDFYGVVNNTTTSIIEGGTFYIGITNEAKITGGVFKEAVINDGAKGNNIVISGGTFESTVSNQNNACINGGTFNGEVVNVEVTDLNYGSGIIEGGTFNGKVTNGATISAGTFKGDVINKSNGRIQCNINDGKFLGTVTNDGSISGEKSIFDGKLINNKSFSSGTVNGELENNGTLIEGTYNGVVINRGTINKYVINTVYVSYPTFSENSTVTNEVGGTILDGKFGGTVINKGTIESGDFTGEVKITFDSVVKGGRFAKIWNDIMISGSALPSTGGSSLPSSRPSESRELYLGLVLGDGCAYYHLPVGWADNSTAVDGDLYEGAYKCYSLENVTVKEHTHTFVKGTCACGYTCEHDWQDGYCEKCDYHCEHTQNNGSECLICGSTLYAKITDEEGNTSYFKSFDEALSALTKGDTLTLMRTVTVSGEKRITKPFTLDLAGNTIQKSGNISLLYFLNENSPISSEYVEIKDSVGGGIVEADIETMGFGLNIVSGKFTGGLSISCHFRVIGGTFENKVDLQGVGVECSITGGTFCGELSIKSVTTSISGGTFSGIVVGDGSNDTTLTISNAIVSVLTLKNKATSVVLSGGTYNKIDVSDCLLTYADIIADGYAYSSNGATIKLANMTNTVSVTVAPCTSHSYVNSVCEYCDVVCGHIAWTEGACADCGYECKHSGGEATCTSLAICQICGYGYGYLNPGNHHGGEATCTHRAICDDCNNEYGDFDASRHILTKVDALVATVEREGNIEYYVCSECGKFFADADANNAISDVVIAKLPPQIIEGANADWSTPDDDGLAFKSNALRNDFVAVLVDGNEIGSQNYVLSDDSLRVVLSADYLSTLKSGEHIITIRTSGGEATTVFIISNQTLSAGAWIGISLAIAIAVVAIIGVIVFLITKKRAK